MWGDCFQFWFLSGLRWVGVIAFSSWSWRLVGFFKWGDCFQFLGLRWVGFFKWGDCFDVQLFLWHVSFLIVNLLRLTAGWTYVWMNLFLNAAWTYVLLFFNAAYVFLILKFNPNLRLGTEWNVFLYEDSVPKLTFGYRMLLTYFSWIYKLSETH